MFGNRAASALSILQKTYDESYLTCSTAVYYESQVRPIARASADRLFAYAAAADLRCLGQ